MATVISKTREQFPLSTKKVLKKTLTGTFVVIIILLFVNILLFVLLSDASDQLAALARNVAVGSFIFSVLLVAITYLYQKWYYDVYFYDATNDNLVIKKGPILPHEITIPYVRIQDVYVDQDILDRIFGLYDVHVSSATISSGQQAHIDGVEKPAADGLRSLLLQRIDERNRSR